MLEQIGLLNPVLIEDYVADILAMVFHEDNGIKALAKVATAGSEYGGVIVPYLIERLRTCRSKSVPIRLNCRPEVTKITLIGAE